MRYLSVEELILIHEYELKRYGGASGIRSIELLESTVFRPQTSYGGREFYDTPFAKAASLVHSIITSHPFVDGNKRTAMVSGTIFLRLNGYKLKISQKDYVKTALDIANHKLDLENLVTILKQNSRKEG